MAKDLKNIIKNHEVCYTLDNNISVPDNTIKDIINLAVMHVPSAFNSQSTRVVLLLREHHIQLWNIVKDVLRKFVPVEAFGQTESKIDNSFASGYGTILFYEDESVIKGLQKKHPSHSDNFPIWSMHASAMHQYAIWAMLEDAGLGASLQHYNPLIDEKVRKTWDLDPKWKLIAQMPFGNPIEKSGQKEYRPLEERVKFFE